MILLLAMLLLLVVGLAYWLVVLAEGAYFGPWAVRLIYRFGAAHYDQVRAAAVARDHEVLLPLLEQNLTGVSNPAVLDVATGTGRVPLLLAGAAWFQGRIAALDLTPEMLAFARARQAREAPEASIEWRHGEAGELPWPNGAFDLVSCLEALEYFPRPRQALAEMARVLRPGGTLLISKIPDHWARLLPGRAFTQPAMQQVLAEIGLEASTFRPWQPGHYEFVLARRAGVVSPDPAYV